MLVFALNQLLALEEEKRQAEEDKLAALSALEAQSLEVLREKAEKAKLEERIRDLQGQLLGGRQSITGGGGGGGGGGAGGGLEKVVNGKGEGGPGSGKGNGGNNRHQSHAGKAFQQSRYRIRTTFFPIQILEEMGSYCITHCMFELEYLLSFFFDTHASSRGNPEAGGDAMEAAAVVTADMEGHQSQQTGPNREEREHLRRIAIKQRDVIRALTRRLYQRDEQILGLQVGRNSKITLRTQIYMCEHTRVCVCVCVVLTVKYSQPYP